jgi:hypothetical protein
MALPPYKSLPNAPIDEKGIMRDTQTDRQTDRLEILLAYFDFN